MRARQPGQFQQFLAHRGACPLQVIRGKMAMRLTSRVGSLSVFHGSRSRRLRAHDYYKSVRSQKLLQPKSLLFKQGSMPSSGYGHRSDSYQYQYNCRTKWLTLPYKMPAPKTSTVVLFAVLLVVPTAVLPKYLYRYIFMLWSIFIGYQAMSMSNAPHYLLLHMLVVPEVP